MNIDQRDHALSRETDVPIEVIHAFRRDHSQMSLQAERLPADAGGERFRVIGTNPDKDGYSSDYVAMDYRADGTRIEDANDDTGRYERLVESVAWERLPEKIRHAASAAVPGAIFAEAFASDAEEAHYEVHLSTTRDRWVVEIDSDGRVRQTRKRDT